MILRLRWLVILMLFALTLTGCGSNSINDPAAEAAPAVSVVRRSTPTLPPAQRLSTPPAKAASTQRLNPFGLLLGGENLSDQHRVDLAKALGVAYFRPWYVTIEDWNGACPDPACELAQTAGLKLILTIRNNAPLGGTTPPTDLNAYAAKLGAVLDKYQPEVVVVENEESLSQSWAGSIDQYAAELKTACQVAHEKNVKCANGGLDSLTVGLLVWAEAIERGQANEACDFVQRASTDLPVDLCRLTAVDQLYPAYRDQVVRGRQLLEVYKTSGQDYLNFHWYIPDKVALSDATALLRRATNLPLMSNEFGQRDQATEPVEKLLSAAVDLQLQYVVWFSLDRSSRALQDENGALRANGEAFRAFMQAHYQSTAELPAGAPTQVPNVVAAQPQPTVPAFAGKPPVVSAGEGMTFTQMLSDVTYCVADDGTDLKMDLYFPIKPAGPAPVVMFVHGGSWVAGTKTGTPGMSYFLELARRGYLIASIDYRLAAQATFPANIEDVKCAVRSLRAHAAEWNLDPNHIGAWGASAGGHLVGLLGTADQSAGWDVGQYLDQSSRVQAVVDLYGIADLTTEYVVGGSRSFDRIVFRAKGPDDPILKAASVQTYITPDDPPFLIMHGDFDETVPYTQSVRLQSALEAGGVPSTLVIVHNGGHGFWARGGPIDPPYPVIARTILNFFDQYLR